MEITAAEWQAVLGRARDVGQAMGAETVAVMAARAAVEALGVRVPVIADELAPAPRAAATGPATQPSEPVTVERPGRDLRVSARTAAPTDGYCTHCNSVYGAQALAPLADGTRLCPVHGTVTVDVTELAEGRYRTARLPGTPRGLTATRERCGAPVGGHPCARDAGHEGRHDPRVSR